jgi:hypothetical protein
MHLTKTEAVVLTRTGTFLGSLAAKDLMDRCTLGRGYRHLKRKERKQVLTSQTSSRLAGSITAATDDQWQLAFNNLFRGLFSLRDAIALIEKRCATPTGTSVTVRTRTTRGYPTPAVRYAKQQRLARLKARLADVESRIESRRVSVVRGGKALLRNRHNLAAAGLLRPATLRH